jgi:hypothetical protein
MTQRPLLSLLATRPLSAIFQFPADAVLLSAVQESDRPALMYSQLPSRRATRPPVICHSLT